MSLVASEPMEEYMAKFTPGNPLPVESLIDRLPADHPIRQHPAGTEDIIRTFLHAFAVELADHPDLSRRVLMQLQFVQQTSLDTLETEVEDIEADPPSGATGRSPADTLETAVEDIEAAVDTNFPSAERGRTAVSTLREQGFKLITGETFENGTINRTKCWHRPFTFAELYAEIPPERRAQTGDGTRLVDDILQLLDEESGVVLRGAPGAGKTTTAKRMATRWYEAHDSGTLLYREE